MKNSILLIAIITLFFSCKNSISEANQTNQTNSASTVAIDYPEALDKVFDHHGSIASWKEMKTLSYEIVKDDGNEKQTIDLYNRSEVIEGSNFKSGYDGSTYWVEADTSYKGNAKFYTNLMFYFYAMPFVLGDDGIVYNEAEPLTFEGVTYPGYKISYEDGVGISPQDEYFIHYDAKTNEMAWLGYTVTYYSGEPSKKISWIRYNDWETFSGIKLPNSLTWYKVEDGKITAPRNTRKFENITLSKTAPNASIFTKPEGAKIAE